MIKASLNMYAMFIIVYSPPLSCCLLIVKLEWSLTPVHFNPIPDRIKTHTSSPLWISVLYNKLLNSRGVSLKCRDYSVVNISVSSYSPKASRRDDLSRRGAAFSL